MRGVRYFLFSLGALQTIIENDCLNLTAEILISEKKYNKNSDTVMGGALHVLISCNTDFQFYFSLYGVLIP